MALRHIYPWYKRLFNMPAAYRVEKHNLKDLRFELRKERELLHHTNTELEALLRRAVEEVLWPQLLPALIMDGTRTELRRLSEELKSFAERLESTCSAQWASGEKVTEVDRLTETTVLNRHKLDLLYQQQLGSRSWGEYAQKMMAFDPPRKSSELKDRSIYSDCRNLRDHLYAGPDLLLARMADYSVALFAPLQSLDTVDMLLVEGRVQAREFLLRALSKTEYLPEFSSGMLPRAQERSSLKRARIISCSSQNREKLRKEFGDLMDENDRFLDIASN